DRRGSAGRRARDPAPRLPAAPRVLGPRDPPPRRRRPPRPRAGPTRVLTARSPATTARLPDAAAGGRRPRARGWRRGGPVPRRRPRLGRRGGLGAGGVAPRAVGDDDVARHAAPPRHGAFAVAQRPTAALLVHGRVPVARTAGARHWAR